MLFVVDVGNTHTVMGMFGEESLLKSWRISTDRDKTSDEYLIIIRDFLDLESLTLADIDGFAIASVVPTATRAFIELAKDSFELDPFVVGIETAPGVPVKFPHPEQIGADRLANAFAGVRLYGSPLLIVDFGTAITFDVIDDSGSYLGGIIAPGIQIASEALFQRAALLSKVDLVRPERLVGTDTATSMRSGIINGYASLVDGLIGKVTEELGLEFKVIATGGLADVVAEATATIREVEPQLTLMGIKMLYEEFKQIEGR